MDGPMETIDGVETGNTVAPNRPIVAAQQSAQPQAGEPVTRDAVAKALHAVDCFDADRDRQLDGLPPVDKWADPWLPTGKRQLEVLLRRADVFLASLSQPTKGEREGGGASEAVRFLYKHGDLTHVAAQKTVDLLIGNGFTISFRAEDRP